MRWSSICIFRYGTDFSGSFLLSKRCGEVLVTVELPADVEMFCLFMLLLDLSSACKDADSIVGVMLCAKYRRRKKQTVEVILFKREVAKGIIQLTCFSMKVDVI